MVTEFSFNGSRRSDASVGVRDDDWIFFVSAIRVRTQNSLILEVIVIRPQFSSRSEKENPDRLIRRHTHYLQYAAMSWSDCLRWDFLSSNVIRR
jgi:hypothetical protein